MGSIVGHAVIGAAMMGFAATADASETQPPNNNNDVATAPSLSGELSNALKQEFFSSSGMRVDTSSYKFLQMGAQAPALSGQVELCKRLPDTCIRTTNEYAPLRVDTAFMKDLAAENIFINASIAPMEDKRQYGEEEYWNFPDTGAGDCEDYVLAKMKSFHEKFGVPLNNMSIVHVEATPDEKDVGGHVVLAVRTSDGDYLFDNQTSKVMFPYETSYKFISATSFENFTAWKDIGSVKYSLIADKNGLPLIDVFVNTPLTNVIVPAFKLKL
jgi:predicted transglutaminase-like cysteine proteinase